jgi:cytidylate kinase
MYRILTVAREYGSGGGPIAEKVAGRLGWALLDNTLIHQIARHAHVDPALCARFDETLDSWVHRLAKRAFGRGAFENVAGAPGIDVFDGDAMAALSRKLIEEAADIGNCIVVGRGAQCILQGRPDAFHVYIYAPMNERLRRVRERFGPARATPDAIRANDRDRAAYVKHHYGCEWSNPHLYHAMFSSMVGEDAVAGAILRAMGIDEGKLAHNARADAT